MGVVLLMLAIIGPPAAGDGTTVISLLMPAIAERPAAGGGTTGRVGSNVGVAPAVAVPAAGCIGGHWMISPPARVMMDGRSPASWKASERTEPSTSAI